MFQNKMVYQEENSKDESSTIKTYQNQVLIVDSHKKSLISCEIQKRQT